MPLPQSKKGNTLAQSEVHFVSPNIFFVLARDGDGHGGDDDKSSDKQADLTDISNATDIHNTAFDDPANPIAVDGILSSSITPAQYVSFVNFLDSDQLARFGLHNGKRADKTLINAKWESLALAPCDDPAFPDDYFLFTAVSSLDEFKKSNRRLMHLHEQSDNDFLSTQGVFDGQSFDASIDVDNQFMVFRVTLPTEIVEDIYAFPSKLAKPRLPLADNKQPRPPLFPRIARRSREEKPK